MKHHYMPEFYLKQWVGDDGRLCEYRRWPGRITRKRQFPAATGYEIDLYKVEGAPTEVAHQFESIFMRGVDTDASIALEKLASGDNTPWSSRIRSAWVRFVLSLIYRNPQTIALLKEHMLHVWAEALKKGRENYPSVRGADDPPTFDEAIASIRPEGPYLAALLLVKSVVESHKIGETLFRMNWSIVKLGKTPLTLLISDRPLERPLGFDSPDAYLALPIGPKTVFVAEHGDKWAYELGRRDPTAVAKALNLATISRGRNFAWAVDDSQLRFVQNRLSAFTDVPILSEAQRLRAIEAVRNVTAEDRAVDEALADFSEEINPETLFSVRPFGSEK